MRLVYKSFVILLMIFLFTGCTIKNENSMLIDKEGKMTYEILVAFDRELLTNVININNVDNNDSIEVTDDVMKEFVKNDDTMKVPYLDGLEKQEYIDENYIGTKYIYKVDHIDKISTEEKIKINIGDFQSEEKLINQKIFTKSDYQYSANYVFELNNEEDYEDVNYITQFKLTLPGRAISHNATNVSNDGKTLTWNLNDDSQEINFTFSLRENKIYFIISIISIIFVTITAILVVLNRKGGKK